MAIRTGDLSMNKDAIPVNVDIHFEESPTERGCYIIKIGQLRRAPFGGRSQYDSHTYRCPSRKGPNWNGERIAAFLEFLVQQFPADAALLDEILFEQGEDA